MSEELRMNACTCLCEWETKAKKARQSASICVNLYLTCVSGGSLCPRWRNERSYEPQSVFHQVQKGGDFPVIFEGFAGQELVDQGQQSLQPQERRSRGRNMSFSTEKQEAESGRGRLSGCIPPQVNINSLSWAETSEHVTEHEGGGTSCFCAACEELIFT